MKRITIMCIAIAAITISSCQKTPVASFTTDKTDYVAGETVKLTNTSTNGETYKWTFPDGQTGSVENYDYALPESLSDGTLTFRLEAFSKNEKKVDEISKTVNVKAATGNVTFWQMAGSGHDDTVVSLNGISSNITSEYSGTPECGASGCAVFNNVKIGTYNFAASDGITNWTGTVKVLKNGCSTMQLQ